MATSTGYLTSPVTCGGSSYSSLTYQGVPCANGFVQWMVAYTSDGCTLTPSSSPSKVRFNQDVFGSCGVPPVLAPGLPESTCKPSPLPFVLQRSKVAQGETVPANLLAIEAVQDGMVVDAASLNSSLTVDQQVVIGVFDTGIDSTHPDLVYAGGESFRLDGSNPGEDIRGHGTVVSGIIGAKNTGSGIAGISSGVPLFALKVVRDDGAGYTSWLLAGLNWMIQNGTANKIKVVNISLVVSVDPASSDFQNLRNLICTLTQTLSDLGIVVVAAAGNVGGGGASVAGFLPAACPTVLAVASIDDVGVPSSFSNWLPSTATQDDKATFIAAPGEMIYSTAPVARVPTGYAPSSGTSFAAPHAAAVAANCIMSGECTSRMTGLQKIAKVQEAAQQRLLLATGSNPWKGVDMTGQDASHYYGLMLWSRF
eukprot:gene12040-12183_t